MLILGNDKKCLHLHKGKCPGCWGLRAALWEECMGIAPSMCCLMSPHCPLFQGLREAVNSVRRDTFLCRFKKKKRKQAIPLSPGFVLEALHRSSAPPPPHQYPVVLSQMVSETPWGNSACGFADLECFLWGEGISTQNNIRCPCGDRRWGGDEAWGRLDQKTSAFFSPSFPLLHRAS